MSDFSRSFTTATDFSQTDELVVRMQEGDATAFEEVFHLYKDQVYRVASRLLVDKGESMDVTQEVFFSLFRRIKRFRGECSLKTWVYRVAVNESANRNRWWRRRKREQAASMNLSGRSDGEASLPSLEPSPYRKCFSSEFRSRVEAGLRRLPYDQRVAVTLCDVEGLSYEEISEVTGARVGTVKSRIARGRESLRALLRGFQGSESS